ncbi:MAG: DUF512 domain-containing protein [bacterium]
MKAKRSYHTPQGAVVASVSSGSPGELAGVRPGDLIVAINKKPIKDFLDFYLAAFANSLLLKVKRNSTEATLRIERKRGQDLGILIDPGRPMTCNNRCIFCFIDQLPKGLRQDLYIKDEDYRLSFLHGNYITMTNLEEKDIERIIDFHLSPIYVSVHATDEETRSRLLGRKHDRSLLETIDRLADGGVKFHCQIVLVPGYNDGQVFESTIEDIVTRSDSVLSISVVPVGLTKHRAKLTRIEPVSASLANRVIEKIDQIQRSLRSKIGRGVIYASDELFEIAKRPIPDSNYYDDYPQFENGVGMIRTFVDSLASLRIPRRMRRLRLGMVTAPIAHKYIGILADLITKAGADVNLVCVSNPLFGESVTVTGLLPAQAIVEATRDLGYIDLLLLPPNVVNHAGLFIDDISLEQMMDLLKTRMVIGGYNAQETISSIENALGIHE